ncbi:MAG: ABC transporter substrate-binding protein [Chloroflexi bacterium]|nr:ABC transporter substrate-binding protein [Chloroflexota bacterium]
MKNSRKWSFSVAILLASVTLVISACAPASAPAPAPQKTAPEPAVPTGPAAAKAKLDVITVSAFTPNVVQLPLYAAIRKGFFERENLKIDQVIASGSAQVWQVLMSKDAQVVFGGWDPALVANEKGSDFVIVLGSARNLMYSFIVRSEIKSLQDLKGKSIGVSSLGVSRDPWLIRRTMRPEGINDNEYDLVAVGGSAGRLSALQSGAIAAGYLSQPEDFVANDAGFPKLFDISKYIPQYEWMVHTVSREWAKQNSDKVKRYIRALRDVLPWIYDPKNKEEVIDVLVKDMKGKERAARQSYDLYVPNKLFSTGELDPVGVKQVVDSTVEIGMISKVPTTESFTDMSYLEQVKKGQ